MFTSKGFLAKKFDVDPQVAAFFVDRRVPQNNRYWHNRLLYVSGGTGFLFIPLYFDLQLRCGAAREEVLNENYVQLNEQILHDAALEEAGEKSRSEHVEYCRSLVADSCIHHWLLEDLVTFFLSGQTSQAYLGTGIPALNRADTMLFALCSLNAPREVISKIVACFYALVPSFLLIDDIVDLQEDTEANQENSVMQFGEGAEGIKKAIEFLRRNTSLLGSYNPLIQKLFEEMLQRKVVSSHIKHILES